MHGEALQHRKEQWLQLHDQQTSGIMGLLPLVKGMPIRFTNSIDKERGVFKHARGVLVGWELQDLDFQTLQSNANEEHVLEFTPKRLFVQMPKTFGEEDTDRAKEDNIYVLKPARRVWHVDKAGTLGVSRFGFEILPDFGGTAHGYCGSTLNAALVDLLNFSKTPTWDDMLRGYIAASRVRSAETLLIVQPYAPMLFRQGVLLGPHLLMEFCRNHITRQEVYEHFDNEQLETKTTNKTIPRTYCGRALCAESVYPLPPSASVWTTSYRADTTNTFGNE